MAKITQALLKARHCSKLYAKYVNSFNLQNNPVYYYICATDEQVPKQAATC